MKCFGWGIGTPRTSGTKRVALILFVNVGSSPTQNTSLEAKREAVGVRNVLGEILASSWATTGTRNEMG